MTYALGPLFDYPIHPPGWRRPAGSLDFIVTTTFDGVDLVNGGMHQAVDVGNFRTGDRVLAPIGTRARGLRNGSGSGTDALGIEFDLGGGYSLQLWHLSATLPVTDRDLGPGINEWGAWYPVVAGLSYARTGNSGANVGGRAMPAHTHIELRRNGNRIDPLPYLLGQAIPADRPAFETREERLARVAIARRAAQPQAAALWAMATRLTQTLDGTPLTREDRLAAEVLFLRLAAALGDSEAARIAGTGEG